MGTVEQKQEHKYFIKEIVNNIAKQYHKLIIITLQFMSQIYWL